MAVVNKMWEITGQETGKAYLKKIDPDKPLPKQVADSIAWSSDSMGEDAKVLKGASDKEAFVRHEGCPWFDWHEKLGLLAEDRPGCDIWFKTLVDCINKELGSNLKVETQESLPDGHKCCLRRIWVD